MTAYLKTKFNYEHALKCVHKYVWIIKGEEENKPITLRD